MRALHFGYMPEAHDNPRTVVEVILTAARALEQRGLSTDDLIGGHDEGDSFMVWGETFPQEVGDAPHGLLFLSEAVRALDCDFLFDALVDAGLADPTANCAAPHITDGWTPWALTCAEDFSVVHFACEVAF